MNLSSREYPIDTTRALLRMLAPIDLTHIMQGFFSANEITLRDMGFYTK